MKRYRTIVADPPWPYTDQRRPVNRGCGRGTRIPRFPYDTLDLTALSSLSVLDMADRDAHLLLWTTSSFVESSYGVARAWGFRPSQLLTWCKPPVGVGPGGVFAATTEFVLYARRGKPKHTKRVDSSWWEWPRGEHSVKPDAFLDLVEETFDGPYLELFARRARFGWDYYGDESLGTAELPSEAA